MPKHKLVLGYEEKTEVFIEVEVEADSKEAAAELVLQRYKNGSYDDALDAQINEVTETRTEVAYHDEEGTYHVLLPWD